MWRRWSNLAGLCLGILHYRWVAARLSRSILSAGIRAHPVERRKSWEFFLLEPLPSGLRGTQLHWKACSRRYPGSIGTGHLQICQMLQVSSCHRQYKLHLHWRGWWRLSDGHWCPQGRSLSIFRTWKVFCGGLQGQPNFSPQARHTCKGRNESTLADLEAAQAYHDRIIFLKDWHSVLNPENFSLM